jgi:hypothetical protein
MSCGWREDLRVPETVSLSPEPPVTSSVDAFGERARVRGNESTGMRTSDDLGDEERVTEWRSVA